MRIAIYTLGCKVNQYETQAMENELLGRGHSLVPFGEQADGYIINTCTVTAHSDKKCRVIIRQARKQNPDAVVAVCGCYAQTDPAAVAALGVDLVMGTTGRLAFLDEVERLASPLAEDAAPRILVDNIMHHREFEQLPAGGMEGRTRAMLKVEDGCVNFCTYCIIPYARGPVRSLPLYDAVCEAKRLAAEGYGEIVLTGIEISSWRQEQAQALPLTLIDLAEAVAAAVPTLRLRLGSLEPRTITLDFCRRAAALPNLCPHFHLSMQSGCDSVLKRMNRKYDTARYYESVKLLREYYQNPAITTDLIVGFPGETEEEFARSLAFAEKCGFSSMHVFPYSRRPGTPAADMEGQIPEARKEERANRARALAAGLEEEYLTRRIGEVIPVLFEDEKKHPAHKTALWRGHAPNYAAVYTKGENLHNVLKKVKIIGLYADGLMGEMVE